jgi:putative ABC transport system permease protein
MFHALDRKLLRDLWRIRGQVLAIALVLGCGEATFVMSFGALASLKETRAAYYERARFAHVFSTLKRAPLALIAKAAHIPGVGKVEGRIVEEVTLDVQGMREPALGRIVSLAKREASALNTVTLRSGRMPQAAATDEILLSEAFAEAHEFKPGDRVGAILNGRKRSLVIAGIALSPEYIYAIGSGQFVPDPYAFAVLWMNRDALEAAFDLENAFNEISLMLMRNANESAVIAALDALLEPYGGTGAFGRRDQTSHAYLSSEFDQLMTTGTVIPPIFLGVAAFLLNIVLTRLIDTEREQIGLLKAFGYSAREIGAHYGKLVSVIATLGLVIGVGAGVWLGQAMTELYAVYYRFPVLYFHFAPSVFLAAACISYAVAAAGTWIAIRRAMQLPPAVAMVPKPPPSYRPTVLDRLGVTRGLSVPGQLILRDILRWPLRAGLTTTGIALSGGLLVMTFFFFDAIERMTELYFFDTQRQDATLLFVEPRDSAVLYDAARLPAVVSAEGFRAVPVILRHGQLSKRVGIQGLMPSAVLSRLLDASSKPIVPPPEGLVLSTKLADILKAKAGDRIIVEAKEGRRPVGTLPLVAIADEYVGLSAYMDRDALNRFMGEASAVSGVHFRLDRAKFDAFFVAAKKTPITAGLLLKTRAVQSFQETFAQSLWTIIAFYVGFGSVITFGVVYNSARIALSERGRELASLRVLGFTKGEVTYILLGELAVLTLWSLPLGALFGYGLSAFMSAAMETELFRIPLYVKASTFGIAAAIVLGAAAFSTWAVARRVSNLNLIAVLKTRE